MSDTSLNKYLAQGDDAAEAAFTPDPVTGTTPEQAVLFVNSETPATPVLKWWDGANFVDVSGGGGGGNVNAGGTLTNNALIIGQGSTDVAATATGTGVLTMLGVNVGSAGAIGAFQFIEELTPTGVSTVTFSSLGAFTHLMLWVQARSTAAATEVSMSMQFNADTGANYDNIMLGGTVDGNASSDEINGATAGSVGAASGASATAGLSGASTIMIHNYRGTAFQKEWNFMNHWRRSTAGGGSTTLQGTGDWRNTAAITSITVFLSSGNYDTGSTLTLYGMR